MKRGGGMEEEGEIGEKVKRCRDQGDERIQQDEEKGRQMVESRSIEEARRFWFLLCLFVCFFSLGYLCFPHICKVSFFHPFLLMFSPLLPSFYRSVLLCLFSSSSSPPPPFLHTCPPSSFPYGLPSSPPSLFRFPPQGHQSFHQS